MAKRSVYEAFKKFSVSMTGAQKESSFQSNGKMTPEEFIEAGDALCQKVPAWSWASSDSKHVPALPNDKKFLVLHGAPSNSRATDMMNIGEGAAGDDEWECPGAVKTKEEKEAEAAAAKEDDSEEEPDWDDEDKEEDSAKVTTKSSNTKRIYSVYVVYDEYYASPRVFLEGTAGNQPLNKDSMMEDVYSENREKTVTVDPHPYTQHPCISIHPCRHAETMKRILDRMADRLADEQEEAGIPEAERINFVFPMHQALFVFLKFISSVIPTIEYDISSDLDI